MVHRVLSPSQMHVWIRATMFDAAVTARHIHREAGAHPNCVRVYFESVHVTRPLRMLFVARVRPF